MADFLRILAALDQVTDWHTVTDCRAKVAAVGVRLIEGNDLARALYYLAGPEPGEAPAGEGTVRELIAALGTVAAARELSVKDIPTDYRVIGREIQEIAPSLRKAGIDIRKRERTKARRGYLIFKRAAAPHEFSNSQVEKD
jgi:hypothetical protein